MKSSLLAAVLTLTGAATAVGRNRRRDGGSGLVQNGWHLPPGRYMAAPPTSGNATFSQLIDHNNPSLGTFEQFYYWDDSFWKGPGSPVVILTPGEVAADGYQGYLGTQTLSGAIAKEIGAAAVVIEHRYWGTSTPFEELTTENMQYQTLENAIADLTNFANNVKLPFTKNGTIDSTASAVPWVLMGGSYAGALTAWTAAKAPGTFWAYLASSAVVETISDFWEYFVPVQDAMPQNCSTDVSKVIDYMDNILLTGTTDQITELKTKFGLQDLEHNDDFMTVLQNGPWLWQSTDFDNSGEFFEWCDYIEGVAGQSNTTSLPGAEGVGLDKAMDGYAQWVLDLVIPHTCEEYGYPEFDGLGNLECFNSYNADSPLYTDTSLYNAFDRQWWWFLCNQPFGWWQDSAPNGTSSLVSRLIGPEYSIRQCGLLFPPGPQGQTYGIAKGATEAETNAYTGGWDIDNTTRLMYTNGEWDPWRYATVSSGSRPGGPLASTAQVPVNVIPEGRHCSDLLISNGQANAGCAAVQKTEIAQIAQWVSEYPKKSRMMAL